MLFRSTLLLSILAFVACSDSLLDGDPTPYDAIIVGGGPSGLSALSGMARVRRRVLLIDSGVYRNGPTRRMHDVLGFDGVTPAYYRDAARKQISFYNKTATMVNGTVLRILPQESRTNNTLFCVNANFTKGGEKALLARKIVLATGMRDVVPDTPGVPEAWGKGIYWCPWCDGYESADQPMGFLGALDQIPKMLRETVTLNSDIIAFVNGTDTQQIRAQADQREPDWETYLDLHKIKVDNRTISRLVRLRDNDDSAEDTSLPSNPHHDLFSVEFATGEPIQRAVFFSDFPAVQASSLGEELGVKFQDGKIEVDMAKGLITSVPGVYGVGDANSDGSTNVPHALYSGKRTAVFMHVALSREDEEVEVKNSKGESRSVRSRSLRPREVWDVMNDQPGEPLYAGEFEMSMA